jgi:hypothetical protein
MPKALKYQVFLRDVMTKTSVIHCRDDAAAAPTISKRSPVHSFINGSQPIQDAIHCIRLKATKFRPDNKKSSQQAAFFQSPQAIIRPRSSRLLDPAQAEARAPESYNLGLPIAQGFGISISNGCQNNLSPRFEHSISHRR